MNWHRGVCLVLLGTLVAGLAFAQSTKKPPVADQSRSTIRVGIAVMSNRSGREASPTWERDQLLRELQRVRTDHKSSIVLEAVSLEGTSKEDAAPEAAQKNCQYLVLTTMVNPRRGPGISGGPDGVAQAPVILGNAKPSQIVAIDFAVLNVADLRTLAEGTSTASVEAHNDTRAADEAMRMTAHRVASELRKDRPPDIE